MSLGVN